ncbi:hypothetical protein [Clostridium sp. OS1-26]|uniref:hypothetical protein n=1 Tax=Clostridium sp. OS1-26 TaxID=3070681 RepID=UPI0027DEEC3A|nr:hypothetical protein [Clostridium sp. OS1-26]WML33331.1 hypothetical protein RCG18_18520 [Clostridium sp. OS1-26]
MILIDEIKEKLEILKKETEKIEEFINFRIFSLHELKEGQVGYSIDSSGNSLVSNEEGSWKGEWIVIGYEVLCGDPIIIDTKEVGFPIFTLMHGMGEWNPGSYLSESIDKFIDEINKINKFISERTMLNTTPRVTCKSLDNLIDEIIEEDEDGDVDNWKSMLYPIYKSTKEYEDAITKKVKMMYENNMKIKDISAALNMSIQDTYIYLKRKIEE